MRRLRSDDLVRDFSTNAFAAGGELLDKEGYTDRLLGIYRQVIARKYPAASNEVLIP